MSDELCLDLINRAKAIANNNFCCNHTNFTVGACLLTSDNRVYTGFNIENDGIMSICAERSAFVKAFTSGSKTFKAIAIVGRKLNSNNFVKTIPCGYCRQFMSEYVSTDFMIICFDDLENKIYKYTLEELLPESFSSK